MARRGRIVKASTVSESSRGYFVFKGTYPNVKHKFFRSKKSAEKFAGKR